MGEYECGHAGTRGGLGRLFDGRVVIKDVIQTGVRDGPDEIGPDDRLDVKIGAGAKSVQA